LTFHENGSGECRKCGRSFDWLKRDDQKKMYSEQYYGNGLYETSEDMIYALSTGTRPEFIFSELVRQGKTTRDANRIVNEALDEYERRQRSQRDYLDSVMGDVESGSSAGFQRTGYNYERPPPERRRHRPQRVQHEPNYEQKNIYYDDEEENEEIEAEIEEETGAEAEAETGMYIELDDDEEGTEDSEDAEDAGEGLYIELDDDDDAGEDFGIDFEREMKVEEDKKGIKLPNGFSVTLPKKSGAKKKKPGKKKKQIDLWEAE
jgi:hypothetical protein